ncbi:hypothetical protein A8C56_18110 [Niabella ginsenosidivorans]|uniref:Uncharacterized protein n=1 Tax=Niabella ginsenosidivorans TaxID=1176587 RepID=A0A1A9I4Z9_9BACT|nr:hypothetical protein [Niabella ginsenosidivorans]ANH82633.1 hypothetical protein A8C56_18110 [Niabella ginsenosidivorans]
MKYMASFKEIYRYYPKGRSPFHSKEDYDQIYLNRKKSVQSLKGAIAEEWSTFVNAVRERVPGHVVTDQSALFHDKFCNYLDYYPVEGKGLFKVHVLLSVLQPYHTILVTDFFGFDGVKMLDYDEFCINNETRHQQYLNEIRDIQSLLEKLFDTKTVYYRDLSKIRVPDVSLKTKKANVNLFDLVFTNYFTNF